MKVVSSTVLAAAVVVGWPSRVEAVPFTITSTLTGDIRPENPDNLFVNVTITGDTTSNVTAWTVDLNSAAHPNMTLGGFFFNLLVDTAVSFNNFTPSAWSISTTTQNAQGSGGAVFMFVANDPPGSTNNVTNSVNLTFNAQLSSGTWNSNMFLNAPLSDGTAIPDPGAQLGAHLRSLSTTGCITCNTDGGFASGNYGTQAVPEPTSLMLLGLGLAGVVASRRRARP